MFNKLKQIKDLRSQANDLKSELSEEIITGSSLDGKFGPIVCSGAALRRHDTSANATE